MTIPDLSRLIYWSQPFGYTSSILSAILMDARRHNTKNDVTGALVCRQDVFIQLLEGPPEKVEETYARISKDDRHVEVTKVLSKLVTTRLFGDWAMLHDPAKTLIWSQDDVASGVLERATKAQFERVFDDLALTLGSASPA